MRVECEHCRALVEPAWSVAGGGEIRACCPGCGQTSTARPEGAAVVSAPAPAAGPECPKCGLAPVTGDACARCGLARERMAGWAEEHSPAPALAAAWETCLAAWGDGDAHDRAASVALTVGEQPWLARRYRAVLRERPGDAVAAARLARLGRIAQAAVLATASTPRVSRFRRGSSYALLAGLVLAIVGALVITLYLVRKNEEQGGSPAGAKRMPATRVTPASPTDAPWQRSELRGPPPGHRVESRPSGQ